MNPIDFVIKPVKDGIEINIHVLPRSSRCMVVGVQNNQLKIKLTKPPVDGKANMECCRFISKLLGIGRNRVKIVKGAKTRYKVLKVEDVDQQHALEVFSACIENPVL